MAEDNHYLQVIRVWAALAWADGEVVEQEARAMHRLIDASGLNDDEKRRALEFLEQPVELDTVGLEGLHESARLGIYRAAARLARVDRQVATEERAFLVRLRTGLGIDDAAALEIEAAILDAR